MDFFKNSDSLYWGWGDQCAHPSSPMGSGGPGSFRVPGPLDYSNSLFSKLPHPHPHSPAGNLLSSQDIAKALNDRLTSGRGFLKLERLTNHVPDQVIKQIPDCASKFQINTPLRLAHFLAQCSHESANFTATTENLNYSANGLKNTFPIYFPGNMADSYARQPQKIASRVYGSRMGNSNEESKDGYKYRGRGYIQLTGKDNYNAFNKIVDDDILNNPDLVSDKYPLLSAAWFWNSRSLNTLADEGSANTVVTKITRKVNGGTIGLSDRVAHFKKYYDLLT